MSFFKVSSFILVYFFARMAFTAGFSNSEPQASYEKTCLNDKAIESPETVCIADTQ